MIGKNLIRLHTKRTPKNKNQKDDVLPALIKDERQTNKKRENSIKKIKVTGH
jgi:hypothetical protein